MANVVIKSEALNGLNVSVDIFNGEVNNAFFASTGNELPDRMYIKLTNSITDMLKVADELEKANG